MAHPKCNSTPLHELVGPAIPQALQLARYQALRSINRDIVEVDENDVICQKPTPEEERRMIPNAAVVSALSKIYVSGAHSNKQGFQVPARSCWLGDPCRVQGRIPRCLLVTANRID